MCEYKGGIKREWGGLVDCYFCQKHLACTYEYNLSTVKPILASYCQFESKFCKNKTFLEKKTSGIYYTAHDMEFFL